MIRNFGLQVEECIEKIPRSVRPKSDRMEVHIKNAKKDFAKYAKGLRLPTQMRMVLIWTPSQVRGLPNLIGVSSLLFANFT